MPITQLTSEQAIHDYLDAEIRKRTRILVRNLEWVGERCRNEAILKHKYRNQTHCLEASVGYVVVVDGRVQGGGARGFAAQTAGMGSEGAEAGRQYLAKKAAEVTSGIALVVVAGMNYAVYVSDRGLDVLDSAEQLARRLVPQLLSNL